MKSKYIKVDIISVLALLPLLLINIVPVLAQGNYSEVIHPAGSTCLVYSMEGVNFYLNVSGVYSIYDNGSLIKQEIPVWVIEPNGTSTISMLFRKYISDVIQNSTTVYEEIHNASYGKYIIIEFENGSTTLSILDVNKNLLGTYQEEVNGSLELVYAWGYGVIRMNISCSEFFNDVNSLGGDVEGNIMYYLALAYTPMIVMFAYSLYFFTKKKIIIRRRIYRTK